MTDQNRPETAEALGRRAGSEGNVAQATQKINDEIGRHLGNPQFNKEFLQSASAELQNRGMLPDMAVDFGKKNFAQLDTNNDGKVSDGEVRRLLQAQRGNLSATDQMAGQYLADRLSDWNQSTGETHGGMYNQKLAHRDSATLEELDKFKEKRAGQQAEHDTAKLAFKAFGNQKDFDLTDSNRDGFLSKDELTAKLADNEKRLAYDKVDAATRQKLEQENRAINTINSDGNFKKFADANSDSWTDGYITLKDIQTRSAEHGNPGMNEGQTRVTDEMVRANPQAEAAAKAKDEAAAAQKVKDDAIAAEQKIKQERAAEEEKVLQKAREIEQRRKDEEKALKDAQDLKDKPAKDAQEKAERLAKEKQEKDAKDLAEAQKTLERLENERKAREQVEAAKKASEAFDKYVGKNLPYTEKNFNDAVKAAAESGKPLVVVVASQKSPDVVTAAAQANLDKNSVVVYLDSSKIDPNSNLGKYAQQMVDSHNSAYKSNDKTATAVYSAVKDNNGNAVINGAGSFMNTDQQTLQAYNQGLRDLVKQYQPVPEVRPQPQGAYESQRQYVEYYPQYNPVAYQQYNSQTRRWHRY